MIALLALCMQAAPPPPVEVELPDDIVVTGKRDQNAQFRRRPVPPWKKPVEGLPKAQVRVLGNAMLSMEGEKAEDPVQSNRAMVRLKIPL